MISFDDIATALSRIPRFNGHGIRPYFIACHSLYVCDIITEKYPGDHELQWLALMHDAAEAYIGDITSPLKALLGPEIKEIEQRIERVLDHVFDTKRTPESHRKIKRADWAALKAEYRDNMHQPPLGWEPFVWDQCRLLGAWPTPVEPVDSLTSRQRFLSRAFVLRVDPLE
jgi:hypothetical protein